jgi:hypothetical protein
VAKSQQADLEVLMLFGTLGRNLCMMMVILYAASLLSQSHRAGTNQATRPDDVVGVAAYLEVSRKIGNVICRVPLSQSHRAGANRASRAVRVGLG